MITISEQEYADLTDQVKWLECLEEAGVDNWDGVSFAMELLSQREDYDHIISVNS